MSALHAELDGIRSYGNTAADVASRIVGAAGVDLTGNVAALTPVFGAIGGDFLAMFAVAQANHAKSVADLAGHYAATAAAAHATAASYQVADHGTAATLGHVGEAGQQA
ncbi:type VII secretion target [Antrihabitans sp. YC2-6]|uniref:type VII secretion target n=1 Tax=Antrihabitans sp. YC2-6 TaxID=2799498 RepID=UPI0018F747D2|nr:type VII secretion target [Antrihabitans sp. YC2-6]MBJ8345271.1 ESX-1 secretion-associated protein [Antrihabitans sp. YC2-6]